MDLVGTKSWKMPDILLPLTATVFTHVSVLKNLPTTILIELQKQQNKQQKC